MYYLTITKWIEVNNIVVRKFFYLLFADRDRIISHWFEKPLYNQKNVFTHV